jgi:hypothetical protein
MQIDELLQEFQEAEAFTHRARAAVLRGLAKSHRALMAEAPRVIRRANSTSTQPSRSMRSPLSTKKRPDGTPRWLLSPSGKVLRRRTVALRRTSASRHLALVKPKQK